MKYFFTLIKNIDRWLIFIVLCFLGISVVMISSTAYTGSFVLTRKIVVQIVAYLLGFFLLGVILLLDYRVFEKMEKIIYVGSLLFLLTVYTPLGDNQYGAQGWLKIGIHSGIRQLSLPPHGGASDAEVVDKMRPVPGSLRPFGSHTKRPGKRSCILCHCRRHDLHGGRQRKAVCGMHRRGGSGYAHRLSIHGQSSKRTYRCFSQSQQFRSAGKLPRMDVQGGYRFRRPVGKRPV